MKLRVIEILTLSLSQGKGQRGKEKVGRFKEAKSGVAERMRARVGVAIVMKEDVWEGLREVKEVTLRLMSMEMERNGNESVWG